MQHLRHGALALVLASIAGCTNLGPPFDERILASTRLAPAAEAIAVYESAPPGPRAYSIVKRLWTESWHSAYHVPRYASVEAGNADLRNHAAALGADAIINFACYDNPRSIPASWHSPLTATRPIPRGLATTPAVVGYTQIAFNCNGTLIKYVQ